MTTNDELMQIARGIAWEVYPFSEQDVLRNAAERGALAGIRAGLEMARAEKELEDSVPHGNAHHPKPSAR